MNSPTNSQLSTHDRVSGTHTLLLAGFGREQIEPSLRAAHQTTVELGAAPLRAELEALARRGRLDLGTGAATAAAA